MERLLNGATLPDRLRGGVAALGNFDGFHRGHQAVIGRAVERARAAGVPALVLTFDPHPAKLFKPELPPFSLTTLDQKLRLLEAFGVDATYVLRFDRQLAAEGPEAFVRDWLVGRLGLTGVVTGTDYTFGKNRAGDIGALGALGAAAGIEAEAVQPVMRGGDVVSSTRIRELLRAGDCAGAADLLSRPFTIEGVVDHGDKLGRTIGFPTANITLGDYVRPAYGVYAVRVQLGDGRRFDGVANLGIRPMFDPPKELLEVYLFDFSGSLYGETLAVELHHFLRPELKLDGLEALKAQIDRDCEEARRRLG